MPKRRPLCVVVPAFNEEKVIESSLRALKRVLRPINIYVVSDGSTDKTAKLAKASVPNVLALRKNVGKAKALERLIKKFDLTKNYRYVMFADADSQLDKRFVREARSAMKEKPACIVGTVSSQRRGAISAFRTFEYGLSHRVFKRAQDIMGVVMVAPGCSSMYRGDVLEQLEFSKRTLTEDFDLTLQIYNKNLGRIIYVPEARVITQDPMTIFDYWKQVTRWYTGYWQNFFLHRLYRPNKPIGIEAWILLIDGFGWFLSIGLIATAPERALPLFTSTYISVALVAGIIIALEQRWWALKYMLLFPLFMLLNNAAYLYSFFRAQYGRFKTLGWNKVARYATN